MSSRPNILGIVGRPHPFWTPVLYANHQEVLDRKKKFRHPRNDLTRWLKDLDISCRFWRFSILLHDRNFCWHLLNCLEAFYKHGMHVSIIDCINIMVDAFIVYESGCDEYDRDSDDNSVWQHRTLCFLKPKIPFAALCMFLNNSSEYHFISDDFQFVLVRRIRSCFRRTDRPGVFSSLSFNSSGVPSYHESGGISLIQILRPSGINYPIESVFQKNTQYKKFGEVFKNLIYSGPFMDQDHFFKRAFGYLGDRNPRQNLTVLRTILRDQCKDVAFTKDELSLVIMQFLGAFPNSKMGVSFMGFQLHTFLRSCDKSLRLKSQLCRPLSSPLPMGCDQLPFDAPAVKRNKMIGFLKVMFSKSDLTSNKHSYLIMKRVSSGLLL